MWLKAQKQKLCICKVATNPGKHPEGNEFQDSVEGGDGHVLAERKDRKAFQIAETQM